MGNKIKILPWVVAGAFIICAAQSAPDTLVLADTAANVNNTGTAIIDGKQTKLYPAVKAGKVEADTTSAPKESLGQAGTSGNARSQVAPSVNAQQNGQAPQSNFSQRSSTDAATTIPIFRMYNGTTGEHLFTNNPNERDQLRARGWGNYEGVAWYAPTSGENIYRLYNPTYDDHLLTRNWNEVNHLVHNSGWNYEGVAFLADTSQSVPVYRVYNPGARSGSHHYTVNFNEVSALTRRGWNYEGIAWYASSQGYQSNDDYNLLNVRNYNQYALGAPSGCEGASLLQALQYKGAITNWNLTQFLNTIPKASDGNPNNGFVGSPFVENSWTYSAIYPAPLTSWGQRFGNVQNISGSSVDSLLNEVKNNNPVVAWVTINFQPVRWGQWSFGYAVNNNHAVTLDGFNRASNQVHVSDPISGTYWMDRGTFENIYNARKYAVVVR